MAKAEITPGIIDPSKEEIESLTGKGAKEGLIPWIPKEWKKGVATALGLATAGGAGAGVGIAAFNWYVEHHPAIVEPVSAAQISPEIGVPQEVETVPEYPEYIERVPVQTEEVFQKEFSPEEKVATKANYFYEVKEGDSLSSIAQKFEIDWPQIAEENNIPRPDFIIHAGEVLTIPLTGIFVSATENFVPSESILLRTAEEANLGISFLNNEILPSYGLNELALPMVDPQEDIIFLPYVGEGEEAPPASAGEKISLYVLDIGEVAWIGEELAIDHSRQDPVRRQREIWKIIHEDVHQVQKRFGYADEFYEKDKDLTKALENITEYIAFLATEIYRDREDGWGSVDEDNLPGSTAMVKQVMLWIENLNNHNLHGQNLVLEYGLKGDIQRFERLYDFYIGDGAFRSTMTPAK